jgi:F0F1-type ATP synthase assembly protein I
MSTGLTISVTMLSGVLVWGGLGYLADHLAGTGKVFTAIGMLIGAAASTYLIYLRYGRENHDKR